MTDKQPGASSPGSDPTATREWQERTQAAQSTTAKPANWAKHMQAAPIANKSSDK
jgi:hypothetical protein